MNTNQGFNALAVLIPVTTAVTQMPDGNFKWVLLGVLSIAATIVGIKTRGDISVDIDTTESASDVLKKGRD